MSPALGRVVQPVSEDQTWFVWPHFLQFSVMHLLPMPCQVQIAFKGRLGFFEVGLSASPTVDDGQDAPSLEKHSTEDKNRAAMHRVSLSV